MIYRQQVRGTLSIEALSHLLDPILSRDGDARAHTEILLDLTGVTFATPGGLAPLASLLERACRDLPPVVLQGPADALCSRYLAVSGLAQALQQFATVRGIDGGTATEDRRGTVTILPLTRLDAAAEMDSMVATLEQQLDILLGCGDDPWAETKGRVSSAVREICANVFHHAGGAPGWVAAQKYYPKNGAKPFLEVAVADAGVGIRESLSARYPELSTVPDGTVLERMAREHLSRHDDSRGHGYFTLQEATRNLDGRFVLRSGSGQVGRGRRAALTHRDGLAHWPGTHLQMVVTCAA